MDVCEDCNLPLAECECAEDDDWTDEAPWEADEPEPEGESE